jgi:DNA-directed RNA polymerase subunit N
MIIPIRCWSCGKPIAQFWEDFKARTANGEPVKKVLDDLGLERYCCRQQLMGHVEIIDVASQFKKY